MDIQKKCWPFEVLPPHEQTEEHRREIAFLERAYAAGYKPYVFGVGNNFGADADNGREGDIIRRGKQRWEVGLYESRACIVAAYLDDFTCAGTAVLEWLGGKSIEDVCCIMENHLASMAGAANRLVVHQGK